MTGNFLQILLTIRVKYYTIKCIHFSLLYDILSDDFAYSVYIYCFECWFLSQPCFCLPYWELSFNGGCLGLNIYIYSILCYIPCLKGVR